MVVDKKMIVSVLRDLGVQPGDKMGLHSSVPSLGRVMINAQKKEGNAGVEKAVNDVIDGFLDAVDRQKGLLMVPTFSYCFVGHKDARAYHPDKTPTRVGMLTDVFRQRNDAVRSLHPTHSVGVIGYGAKEIIKDHEKKTPIGADSPFHRLALQDGWICYLGTNSKTLSLLHLAEVLADVPYSNVMCYKSFGWKEAALVEKDDGSTIEVPLRENPGCSEGFGKFDELMEEAGIAEKSKIYISKVRLFKAKDSLQLAVDKLKEDPFFLLCPKGKCPYCDVRWNTCAS